MPFITLLVLYKAPILLFNGWQQLLHDLIGREGPFLEIICVPFSGLLILLWPIVVVLAALAGITSGFFFGYYAAVIAYQVLFQLYIIFWFFFSHVPVCLVSLWFCHGIASGELYKEGVALYSCIDLIVWWVHQRLPLPKGRILLSQVFRFRVAIRFLMDYAANISGLFFNLTFAADWLVIS